MASAKKTTQVDKFKDLARQLEADESEEKFDEALKRVAKAPAPQKDSKQRDKGRAAKK